MVAVRAMGSPTTAPARAHHDGVRTAVVRRLLLVLGFVAGGWLVSALIAGAAAAEDEPPELSTCSHEADGTREHGPLTRADLPTCEALPAPENPAGDLDGNVDEGTVDEDTDEDFPESTEPVTDEVDPAPSGTEPTVPSDDGTGGDHVGNGDRASDTAELPDTDLPDEADTAPPRSPEPEADRKPTLLSAATTTLLSTTKGLVHTTGHLTGLLFTALPEITEPIQDTIEGVVDVPGALPITRSPTDVLPGITLPRLPIGVSPLAPAHPDGRPDRPDERRVEPVTAPREPAKPPAGPRSHLRTDRATESADTSRWTPSESGDTEARDGRSPRPLGPLAPSPAAPAPATAQSTTASPQDGFQHLHRGEHGILGAFPTVTQLRLLGSSRDHGVAGVSREAALPTTSPD